MWLGLEFQFDPTKEWKIILFSSSQTLDVTLCVYVVKVFGVCVCVEVFLRSAVLFICILCCLPCAGATPAWTYAMAATSGGALMFDQAGVPRKHGLKVEENK